MGMSALLHHSMWGSSGGNSSPMLVNIYMLPFVQLVWSFGLECHIYTNDTQLYLLMGRRPDATPSMLTQGLEVLVGWLNLTKCCGGSMAWQGEFRIRLPTPGS